VTTPRLAYVRARATLLIATLLIAGCTSAPPKIAGTGLGWHQLTLPTDPRGRAAVRDVTACDGHVYVAGTWLGSDGSTAPALWTSTGGAFTNVAIKPISVYGPDNALLSVACAGSTVVAVGAKSGGAHGNPRTSTWVSTDGGPLTEVGAAFELFGGPDAVGVGPVSGGPAGFLIVGGRNETGGSGAAVWHSIDGRAFTLVDADPAVVSDARGTTEVDGSTGTAYGFVAVGAITPPHSPLAARDPLAWTSSDGRYWQRMTFPATAPDDLLQRATTMADGSVLAVGSDGSGFRAWRLDATGRRWSATGTFGATGGDATVPAALSMTASGPDVYAVVSDGERLGLWRGPHWQRLALPADIPAAPVLTGPRVAAVAELAGQLVLATDDGNTARVWISQQ
jgi:hypothetical protein